MTGHNTLQNNIQPGLTSSQIIDLRRLKNVSFITVVVRFHEPWRAIKMAYIQKFGQKNIIAFFSHFS